MKRVVEPDFGLGGRNSPRCLTDGSIGRHCANAYELAPAPKQRYFIVGCPRSGTTLLQSIIASHEDFVSFPETQFFVNMVYDIHFRKYGRRAGMRHVTKRPLHMLRKRLGYACPRFQTAVRKFLTHVGRSDLLTWFSGDFTCIHSNVTVCLRILDELSGDNQWVEKSPNHLFCVDVITPYVREARFIHIVRRGEDAIASIYDAARRYPSWTKRYGSHSTVERLVALWIRGLHISLRYRNDPNHLVLLYEDLITDPVEMLKIVCNFLGVGFSPTMLRYTTEGLITRNEQWKANTNCGIIYKPESKFTLLFSREQQRAIKARIEPLDERRRSLSAVGGRSLGCAAT